MIEIVVKRDRALMWNVAIRNDEGTLWSSLPYKWKTARQAFEAGLVAAENLDITTQ